MLRMLANCNCSSYKLSCSDMNAVLLRCSAGTGKLDVVAGSNADVIGLDWSTSMRVCRQTLGPQHKVQGNVDPMVLFGTQVRPGTGWRA
jgi:uroporphyrinogen-III decarboxylase